MARDLNDRSRVTSDPVDVLAESLLRVAGGSRVDAAHVASALQAHRRSLRTMGVVVPDTVEVLEHSFARVAMPGSPRVIEGHRGSEVGDLDGALDAVLRDDATVDLLSREQAARRLGCSVSTLKRRERAGRVSPVRHGRVVRYRIEDIDELQER